MSRTWLHKMRVRKGPPICTTSAEGRYASLPPRFAGSCRRPAGPRPCSAGARPTLGWCSAGARLRSGALGRRSAGTRPHSAALGHSRLPPVLRQWRHRQPWAHTYPGGFFILVGTRSSYAHTCYVFMILSCGYTKFFIDVVNRTGGNVDGASFR